MAFGKRSLLAVLKPMAARARPLGVWSVDVVTEDVVGVGVGDGEIESGQQIGQRLGLAAFAACLAFFFPRGRSRRIP
jgi:hypothetical protein